MSPVERAFLNSVLRYRTLRHEPRTDLRDFELSQLEVVLGARGPVEDERRTHRRVCMRMRGTLRSDGWASPCLMLDIGAGGVRISNDGGLDLAPGSQVVVSLHPGDIGLRIDVPAVVCYLSRARDDVGLKFCGPLVVSHQRGTVRAPSGTSDRRTVETPIARSDSTPIDLDVDLPTSSRAA